MLFIRATLVTMKHMRTKGNIRINSISSIKHMHVLTMKMMILMMMTITNHSLLQHLMTLFLSRTPIHMNDVKVMMMAMTIARMIATMTVRMTVKIIVKLMTSWQLQ